MFLFFVPYAGNILAFVGLILLLIGAKGLADYYRESGIFNNALYGALTLIVGFIAFTAVIFVALAGFLTEIGLNIGMASYSDPSAWMSVDWGNVIVGAGAFTWLSYMLLSLVILFVVVVIAAVFFRKSMLLSAQKSGIKLFGTAGLLTIIGAVLTIIFIGAILLWIALLLIAIAFFRLQEQPQTAVPLPP